MVYRKSHCFGRALQHYYSPADWARELFKPSADSASLKVQTYFFVLGVEFSSGSVTLRAGFRLCGQVYLAHTPTQWAIFWLNFVLDLRLSSESLESLIGLLAYLDPKLWLHKQKLVKILPPQMLTLGLFHGHNSPADWVREFFVPCIDGESLVKKYFRFGCRFFIDVCMMGVCLCIFFFIRMTSSGPGRQRQEPFFDSIFIGK